MVPYKPKNFLQNQFIKISKYAIKINIILVNIIVLNADKILCKIQF